MAAGAKFAAFGGWSMPLEYAGAGVLAEHAAVRDAVGIFDVSHLGKARVAGPGAADFVNRCLTADLGKIAPGQAQYTLICNDDGGVVDDLIAYLSSPDEVFLIPNAANCAEVVALLAAAAPAGIEVDQPSTATTPCWPCRAPSVRRGAGGRRACPSGTTTCPSSRSTATGEPVTVCRTGYTGERGYELVVPAAGAVEVWDAVVAAGEPYGLQPAGLGARDTLRTEMGYPLHGQDISPDDHSGAGPAGLGGRLEEGRLLRRRGAAGGEGRPAPTDCCAACKAVGRGIPRPGMMVRDGDGDELGAVTSGTFSPTLKTGIALALIDSRISSRTTSSRSTSGAGGSRS